MTVQAGSRTRPVNVLPAAAQFEHAPGGITYVQSPHALPPYPARLTERLEHWAAATPDRVFLAQRGQSGGWESLTYVAALNKVRRVGQALLNKALEGPVAILSGNSIDHALLALACMYTGTVYAPISPAYSLVSA
jgi:feruloyl-CoA synthase